MLLDNEVFAKLEAEFGGAVSGPHCGQGSSETADPWITVEAEQLIEVMTHLRDTSGLEFAFLNDLTVVDYLPIDKKFAKQLGEPRFEVVYQLSSLTRGQRLTVKVTLPRPEGPDSRVELASVAGLWKTAEWHECEAFDLFGVEFTGHPNLRRLLCPDDWEGHALRKDYQMPLEYHGIRGR